MAHAKQQVRAAFASVLGSALSIPLRQTRFAFDRKVGDHALIYVDSEAVEQIGLAQESTLRRVMQVSIRGRLRDIEREANEDRADAFCAQVEAALTWSALQTELSNKLKNFALVATAIEAVDDESDRPFLEIALDYQAAVMTVQGDPETLI